MRPVQVTLSAAGNSAWIPVNRIQPGSFKIGLAVYLSSGAVLTYRVQHTLDHQQDFRPVTIARSTTVATVTDVAHKLSVGDSIVVSASGSTNLDGTYDVASVVDADNYTYTVANSGATAGSVNSQVKSYRVLSHTSLVDLTARADGNYEFPPVMIRLRVTAYTSGSAILDVIQP